MTVVFSQRYLLVIDFWLTIVSPSLQMAAASRWKKRWPLHQIKEEMADASN